MAKLTGGAPVLLVTDVAASAVYYRDKLGFVIDTLYGEPAHFGLVHRDGFTVCFGPATSCRTTVW